MLENDNQELNIVGEEFEQPVEAMGDIQKPVEVVDSVDDFSVNNTEVVAEPVGEIVDSNDDIYGLPTEATEVGTDKTIEEVEEPTNNSDGIYDAPIETSETDENKEFLSIENRKVKLKYNIRAICVIDEVYKILEEAVNEGIREYKLMYAYDEQLYTMGYETKDRIIFAVWCPDGSVRTFESIDAMKSKVTLGHSITILREFLTGNEGRAVEVSLEDNFMLKVSLVHDNNKDYNMNLSVPISNAMQKLADSRIEKIGKSDKLTIIAVISIVVVLLILLFTVFK